MSRRWTKEAPGAADAWRRMAGAVNWSWATRRSAAHFLLSALGAAGGRLRPRARAAALLSAVRPADNNLKN